MSNTPDGRIVQMLESVQREQEHIKTGSIESQVNLVAEAICVVGRELVAMISYGIGDRG